MIKVLFVCLGNICRSPLAEGVFRRYAEEAGLREGLHGDILIDSAGTLGHHVGAAPDPRSIEVARTRGIDISGQRCRQIQTSDFETFDYILAMDRDNMSRLQELCPPEFSDRLHMFLPFASDLKGISEIPDPYLYKDMAAFERVYDFVERAASGLVQEVVARHFPQQHLKMSK